MLSIHTYNICIIHIHTLTHVLSRTYSKSSRYSGTFQVRFVNLHSSLWHLVFWGQTMSSNFKCLVLVKRLFILTHMHTHIHRSVTWDGRPQMHTRPRTHTAHMAHRYSHPINLYTWSEVRVCPCDCYTRTDLTQWGLTVKAEKNCTHTHAHTHKHHTSFNPRCLRESEGKGESEHNSKEQEMGFVLDSQPPREKDRGNEQKQDEG